MPVNHDLSNAEYHALPHLSASGAKTIAMQSLADYKHGERKETTAMIVGTAVHTLVFEPNLADTIWHFMRTIEAIIRELQQPKSTHLVAGCSCAMAVEAIPLFVIEDVKAQLFTRGELVVALNVLIKFRSSADDRTYVLS